MTVEALRCALLGVSAYRNITAQPLMADAAALLEALSLGRGEEAVERYARVPGPGGLAVGCPAL